MGAALAAALRDFFRPAMLGLVLWPLLGSLLLWSVLGVEFWHDLVSGLQHLASVPAVRNVLGDTVLHWFAGFSVAIVLFLVFPPLVQATALLITAFIAMPRMIELVGREQYSQLERRHGGTAVGSAWNAIATTLVYLLLWLACLPLWVFLVPAAGVALVLNAWLNERLFRYDALAEHASPEEYAQVRARAGWSFFGLGLVAALIQLVPLLNLISPVYSGLSFVHFALAELRKLRAEGKT